MVAERTLRLAAGAASVVFLLLFLGVALARLRYPFELEWIEGALADHVRRVLAGEALYVAPSLDFVPYFYPPLYFWSAALVAALTGPGLLPLRLVSLGTAVVLLALLARWVRRETGSPWAALVGTGLFAATYPLTMTCLDLGRVDSLFLLLLLGGLFVLRFATSPGGAAAAGALLALAALSKQTAIAAALPALVAALLVDRRRGAAALLSAAAAVGVAALALHLASDGWSTWYLWTMPGEHGIETRRLSVLWPLRAGAGFWVPLALLPALVWRWRRERPRLLFYGALLVGCAAAAALGRLHGGGSANTLLPAYLALSLLAGIALGTLAGEASPRAQAWPPALLRGGLQALLLAQLLILLYDPRPLVPAAADEARGRRFLGVLAAVPGEVLVPWHGHVGPAAGKPPSAHVGAMYDVLRSSGAPRELLRASIERALADGRYDAIVLDRPWFERLLEPGYLAVEIPPETSLGPPVAGMQVRPRRMYVRRPTAPARGLPE